MKIIFPASVDRILAHVVSNSFSRAQTVASDRNPLHVARKFKPSSPAGLRRAFLTKYCRDGRTARNVFAAPESTAVANGPSGLELQSALPLGFFCCHWLVAEYIMASFPLACLFRATRGRVHTALFRVSSRWGSPASPSHQNSFLLE